MKNIFNSVAMSILLFASSCSVSEVIIEGGDTTQDIVNEAGEVTKNIDQNVTFEEGKTYYLPKGIHVTNGSSLTIEPGVTIECAEDAYLLVETGSKIFAEGKSDAMIVFTSKNRKEAGAWGGLLINGNAPINVQGGTAVAEVGDASYGGDRPVDNSGVLRFVRVEFGGYQINSEKEHNGFTFNGVGSGTVLENLIAFDCSDDGFEFFGGTVNGKNLVAIGSEDDLFDWTYGWSGTVENIYGRQLVDRIADRGIEADNNSKNLTADPLSNPLLRNLTLMGNGGTNEDGKSPAGVKLRRGTAVRLENAVISGFGGEGINLESNASIENVIENIAMFSDINFSDNAIELKVAAAKGEEEDAQKVTEAETIINAASNANASGAPQELIDWAEAQIVK
ncbi:hypothetical protein [Aureibacter tunicatorum]|uniref:Mor family transcriptional regulator n=1 Tax=Aureibacter tunicatorum TaxID=866807 RepID=A0AAE3XRL6_9BACT|nr:hypothetical protein [Aureibacter tunicatorum]MDR6241473.1 Mor family transcriptional regulator [Aureibacter tunicatorum]BDD06684.1 hypothetical protein AUTU_41670 [Aureibacter tunicatorum]